ncbi:O-antigen polymerase [Adlercreutzia sp. ZJ304]|uniref:O-antigen polymerase n=1 Tax=Adlercreutzia sp. ZJ304 TaxID=2709791 RepID=UPI0013ECDA34|nr:O-antigen polymerase [Adlercreutzia sp. ZJ304]
MSRAQKALIVVALFTCCVLMAILLIALLITRYDIMSPGPIFTMMFLLGTAALIVLGNFELDIHWNTASVIICACTIAIVGDVFVRAIAHEDVRKYKIANRLSEKRYGLKVSPKFNFFICVVMVLVFVYTYWDIQAHTDMSLSSSGTLLGAFREQGSNKSMLSSLMNGFSSAIAYFYSYMLIINALLYKPMGKKYWLPIALYIPIILVTGARIQLLFFLGVFAFQFVTIYFVKNERTAASFKKLLAIFIVMALIFVAIFYFAGFLTGKSSGFRLADIALVYAGGPIYGLDWFLQRFDSLEHSGITSFESIHSILSMFGVSIGEANFGGYVISGSSNYYPIVPERGLYGNVYTTLVGWIYDFGLIGAFLILFLLCVLFSWMYGKARASKKPCIPILALSILYIPMLMVSVTDLFSDDLSYKRILVIIAACVVAQEARKMFIGQIYKRESLKIETPVIKSLKGESCVKTD